MVPAQYLFHDSSVAVMTSRNLRRTASSGGGATVSVDGTELAAYDPERMLLELMRSRNKLCFVKRI